VLDGIGLPSVAHLAAVAKVETVFMDLLDEFAASGRRVSHKEKANNYAPAMFADTEKGKAVGKTGLKKAMSNLFDSKAIRVGPNPDVRRSHAYEVILRVDALIAAADDAKPEAPSEPGPAPAPVPPPTPPAKSAKPKAKRSPKSDRTARAAKTAKRAAQPRKVSAVSAHSPRMPVRCPRIARTRPCTRPCTVRA
jgi:hypothetical protein